MTKTARVAELAVKLASRAGDCIESGTPSPFHVPGPVRLAADAAALVRLADAVTACDVVECNGGAVDHDDAQAKRVEAGFGAIPGAISTFDAWAKVSRLREERVIAADKRRARALAKAAKLAGAYGLSVFHQGDPRGASLYLFDPAKHGEPHAGWDQHAPGVVCV